MEVGSTTRFRRFQKRTGMIDRTRDDLKMKITMLNLATMVLASGCAPDGHFDTAKALMKPTCPDHGVVTGKTMHITFDIPGALAGKPGRPVREPSANQFHLRPCLGLGCTSRARPASTR